MTDGMNDQERERKLAQVRQEKHRRSIERWKAMRRKELHDLLDDGEEPPEPLSFFDRFHYGVLIGAMLLILMATVTAFISEELAERIMTPLGFGIVLVVGWLVAPWVNRYIKYR